MPPAGFEIALPATKLTQFYALDCATTGIGDCGVTNLKVTDLEGSETNIAIEQMKAKCVHIIRV